MFPDFEVTMIPFGVTVIGVSGATETGLLS